MLISYLSALGIGTIVFQLILGQEMHWSLPGLSFILLVAVGADYNMLLISRIRDESPHGIRIGVIRTVGSTGGVITSAGLIFAASMFGLVAASINTMAQAGFTIGIGIVLDTFLVRTVTVPALTTLIGRANWWPSHLGRSSSPRAVQRRQDWKYALWHLMPGLLRRKLPAMAPPPRPTAAVSLGRGRDAVRSANVPLYDLGGHALPLFGPIGLPQMTSDLRAAALAAAAGNGSNGHLNVDGDVDEYVNGDGDGDVDEHGNGNGDGNGHHPVEEELASHPLPLFSLAGARRNGGGNGGHLADDDAVSHSLPLFTPIDLPDNGNGGNGTRAADHQENER